MDNNKTLKKLNIKTNDIYILEDFINNIEYLKIYLYCTISFTDFSDFITKCNNNNINKLYLLSIIDPEEIDQFKNYCEDYLNNKYDITFDIIIDENDDTYYIIIQINFI